MSNATVIEALEGRVADMERKANAIIEVINDLRKEDGLGPRPSFGSGAGPNLSGSGNAITKIKPDTFYGKKMQTAIREYLEMRKAQGDGPASPREIYDAIVQGGYKFDAKDETIALVSLRALMRKRSAFFHKLPNGAYGLTAWYPDLKKPKAAGGAPDDDDDAEEEVSSANEDLEEDRVASTPKKTASAGTS